MDFTDLLGRFARLRIVRFGPPGAFLAIDRNDLSETADTVLLPGGEIPEGAHVGDELEVFLYKDSESRPVATVHTPKLELDQVTFLTITAITPIGAFVDWGLGKELLVPFAEQTVELEVGDRHPIGLYLDKSDRLTGTMRVSPMLDATAEFESHEWVEGEAWRNDPEVGLFVIIEKEFVGLVPAYEPHTLSRGDVARFRVARVHPDGKIELSLRKEAVYEMDADGEKILAKLARPGAPKVGDKSDPEQIRSLFALSKKAFKRAVGRLLKDGKVAIDAQGFVVVSTNKRAS